MTIQETTTKLFQNLIGGRRSRVTEVSDDKIFKEDVYSIAKKLCSLLISIIHHEEQ